MELSHAIILGVVEGITEFLPVSSTGHLLLTQRLLQLPINNANNGYAIAIQGGAILAVLSLYHHRFWSIILGLWQWLRGAGMNQSASLGFKLLAAFFPAAVIGYLLDEKIEQYLFGLLPVAIAWAVGGVVILLLPDKYQWGNQKTDKVLRPNHKKTLMPKNQQFVKRGMERGSGRDELAINFWQAVIIGLAQILALMPGVSRSLSTILAGLWVGLSRMAAVEFSFLLGVITLTAASSFKLVTSGDELLSGQAGVMLLVGLLVSWLTAWLAVKWLVHYLQHHSFRLFGYWRIIAAIIAIAWLWFYGG